MKLRSKLLLVLLAAYWTCSSVVSVGHEVAGITLNVWWDWADRFQALGLGYAVIYPFIGVVSRLAKRGAKGRHPSRIINDIKTEGIPAWKRKGLRVSWLVARTHWSDRDQIGSTWKWYKVWQ